MPPFWGSVGKGEPMKENFDLQEYLSNGIERFVADEVKPEL